MEIGKKKNDSIYIDKSFSRELASSCLLLIQSNRDSIRFIVANQEDLKLFALVSYSIEKSESLIEFVTRVFETQEIFTFDFAIAKAYLNGIPCTLIPAGLQKELSNEKVLSTSYSDFEGEVKKVLIEPIAANFIYSEPKGLSKVIHNKLPYCSIESEFPKLFDALRIDTRNESRDMIHVEISASFFECIVFSKKQLVLHNWFEIGSDNDLL